MGLSAEVVRYRGDAAPADLIASCVAQAFESYEPWIWCFGDRAGTEADLWYLQQQVNTLLHHKDAVAYTVPITCDGDVVGCAAVGFLVPCSAVQSSASITSIGEQMLRVWKVGPRAWLRLREFDSVVQSSHARDAADVSDHYMVSLVGVLPRMQGRGLASRVLKTMLADADTKRLPVYLFTGNDRNEKMYRKYGFVSRSRSALGSIPSAREEVVFRSMLRPQVVK